ncbi:hypothetical protein METBIDRAFT_77794 [Metschnikowia bicuspidata var. bicuspidata NRRL YB-4993]|uniref:Zn(2)-C6 fungal-type domain-containing protein n=1 Tax=Metschnikowia bicuspidata var. bicuspidata NRRL YB-4993 TaxID=869754 RepID=A0A1A0HEP2_9ASCO|nr:hypothetical protein METBIDRAFT_77794 [Metschnikowia bicuspidata var. bicuspidata NRRL YB-4993]OBA22378.1 hypothetical protein METBIDRAFT_77794 [Metschnikowia bicuspidata var. bicuspidata NRRL YB-4993]
MPTKKTSCDRCHRRKELCIGQPCQRCQKDGVTCETNRLIKKLGRPKEAQRRPVRRKYSRHGCMPCRTQKKKCDEQRPSCGRCLEKNRCCAYGTKAPEADHELAMTPQTFFNAIEQLFFECLQNKTQGTETASAYSSPAELSSDQYREQKHDLLQLCSLNAFGIPAKESELLCYFISDVSMLLFADKTTPRFLATVIPMCLEDERVRFSILAIASAHRHNGHGSHKHELMRDAVRFRAMAQFCLAGQNQGFYDDTENVLLSICLVAIHEIFEGTSLYWNCALEKGAEIIRVRGGLQKVSRLSPLSIQLFCYLDHISSLSTCVMPYVDRLKNNPYHNYNGNQVEDILNCKFGFRFGIAGELFKIMGNISTLASLRKDRHSTPEHGRQFDRLANMIEMELQNWAPSLRDVSDNFRIDGTADSGRLTISSYLVAVQWACFLRLHQIIVGYDRRDSRITACLSILLESLKSILEDTEIETGLMFPLVMAGLVCVESHDREYISSRIQAIQDKLRFNYIGEFQRLLHAVWAQDADAGDAVNWALIRYYEFPGLVMF